MNGETLAVEKPRQKLAELDVVIDEQHSRGHAPIVGTTPVSRREDSSSAVDISLPTKTAR